MGHGMMHVNDYDYVGRLITQLGMIREKKKMISDVLELPQVQHHLHSDPESWNDDKCPILDAFDANAHILGLSGCYIMHETIDAVLSALVSREASLIIQLGELGVTFAEDGEPEEEPEEPVG